MCDGLMKLGASEQRAIACGSTSIKVPKVSVGSEVLVEAQKQKELILL